MQQAVLLSNGVSMPLVGFGTYKIRGKELIFSLVKTALEAGYRSFDTAAVYRNESELGQALKHYLPEFGLKREDVFITSKLSPSDQGSEKCRQAVKSSLAALQVDYLDLFLIHWPGAQRLKPSDPLNRDLRTQSWATLEELNKGGIVRAIGVSNYTLMHLTQLLEEASVVPHVNQVEYHPHYVQEELKNYCEGQGIHLQAYSSLGTTVQLSPLLQDPTVTSVAKRLALSPAQVLLRWATQQGIGVLPKSTNPEHIRQNIQLDFHLSPEELQALSKLKVNQKYAWNPVVVL
ncbi:glyoxal reductase-like isoform X1 [Eriocheir sinensis]|uniref:glyoxal reductase-like isoform X1 n=1 Tax=Eriocheir sinensis TaxID=95602 RepID=UPI0021C978A6|nr:glyoxal reductase-like isoform X1 [Eriocheir sinensis]XP_050689312.1 glyoxal reductase-like isoform X1 [Eriocheir sinensis]XP_050689316.1 glyoxal reductase-like isoform X1 [Eriocheir sinensis]XP_050689317.1 glyoxal reductase-like isoform X1 [Eriocheir sinensis]